MPSIWARGDCRLGEGQGLGILDGGGWRTGGLRSEEIFCTPLLGVSLGLLRVGAGRWEGTGHDSREPRTPHGTGWLGASDWGVGSGPSHVWPSGSSGSGRVYLIGLNGLIRFFQKENQIKPF